MEALVKRNDDVLPTTPLKRFLDAPPQTHPIISTHPASAAAQRITTFGLAVTSLKGRLSPSARNGENLGVC